MQWLDEYETKLDIASPLDMDGDFNGFTLDENETIIAASPQMVAKLIAAVREAEKALDQCAERLSDMIEVNAPLSLYAGVAFDEVMETINRLQSGEFGKVDEK